MATKTFVTIRLWRANGERGPRGYASRFISELANSTRPRLALGHFLPLSATNRHQSTYAYGPSMDITKYLLTYSTDTTHILQCILKNNHIITMDQNYFYFITNYIQAQKLLIIAN